MNQPINRPAGHTGYTITNTPRSDHVAVCNCGWRSDPMSHPGMVGTAWDRHVDLVLTELLEGT
jgi:hypothetical protein